MFDLGVDLDPPRLRGWTSALADTDLVGDAAAQVDELRALEELVCAAQARQLRLAVALDAGSRTGGASPSRWRWLDASRRTVAGSTSRSPAIAHELPHVMAAFRRGLVTEWRVSTIARETACLSLEDRLTIDRAIAGDPEAFAGYSDRVVVAEVRKLAARLDPAAVAKRRRRAESERRVTVRPAPDTMVYLSALLPVAEGVAAYAALSAEAKRARAAGDPRTRGQVMADALVARITGAKVDAGGRPSCRSRSAWS